MLQDDLQDRYDYPEEITNERLKVPIYKNGIRFCVLSYWLYR